MTVCNDNGYNDNMILKRHDSAENTLD